MVYRQGVNFFGRRGVAALGGAGLGRGVLAERVYRKLRRLSDDASSFMVTCSFNWPHDPNRRTGWPA